MDSALDIESFIPHRERMKLIDGILKISEEETITMAKVSESWPLYQKTSDSVEAIVLIEILAQTAAVHIGRKPEDRKEYRRGWLVGIKNADFFQDRIPVNTILTATVKNLYEIDFYTVIEGEVRAGKEPLCRLQIQVLREGDHKE